MRQPNTIAILTVVILCLASDSRASEAEKPSTEEVQAAWTKLAETTDLDMHRVSDAIETIVRAGNVEDQDRLMQFFEREGMLKSFTEEDETNKRESMESLWFTKLTRQIALCHNALAEGLLLRFSQSKVVTGKMQYSYPGTYERGIAVMLAVGYLQPSLDETYELLKRGLAGQLNLGETWALRSLTRIGNERAAEIVWQDTFANRTHWTDGDFWIYQELGQGRHRPAIFGLLLRLVKEVPTERPRELALQALANDKSSVWIPHTRQYTYPDYKTLPQEDRDKLWQLVKRVDASKFGPKSGELLARLQGSLVPTENDEQ